MTMKKRAKALHDFQHDPPTTIFLLSMRAGAVGINLTQANRVFLMEPHFNPALEAQAIGRVHRLGQKRNVEIIRLVMKDSVETRVIQMIKKKYGDSSGAEAEPAETAMVGSIQTDKATLLAAEFDLLFGIASSSFKAEALSGTSGGESDPFASVDI
jgi:superfamily II DNA or RNA helicase